MGEFGEMIAKFFIGFGTSILESVAVLLVGIIAIRLAGRILRALFQRTKTESTIASFIISLVRAALALVLFFTILKILNVDTTGVISIAAASGIAVGFAMQDSLSNVASGVILLFTKPFAQSDYVKIGDSEGQVTKINITMTELTTADNILISIPNKQILGSEIINYSKHKTRRISVKVPAAYECDPDMVSKVILEVINDELKAATVPAPSVYPIEFGASAVMYAVKFWVSVDDYWSSYNALFKKVLLAFRDNGIEIPYDKLTVISTDGGK
ncbi:MAG: mechanosensitive ion channel family protein [Christensenellaceae bacterium]|nr:mechanosensitive ion channel family protein [Christensenellaceae bacterium]